MDNGDRLGLLLLLVVIMLVLGLVIGNASISGLSVLDLFKETQETSNPQKSITLFTIALLATSIIVVFAIYFVQYKND